VSVWSGAMTRRPLLLALAALLASVPAACGHDSDSSKGPDCMSVRAGKVTLVAKNIMWDTDCITLAKPGPVRFTLRSEDQAAHNIHVSGQGIDEKTELQAGPMVQHLTVDLAEAGRYTYICDLHEFTMKGTLTVG
jgi:plastocyanin